MQLFANIPEELKENALWCMWRLTEKGKVPFNPATNQHAESSDKSTFSTYNVAMSRIADYIGDGGIGLGVFNGYSGIDIDKCIDDDGNISDKAMDIINSVNSYTEKSPSGHGIRIIFKTNYKLNKDVYYIKNATEGLEVYISDCTNRFLTITGNTMNVSNTINFADISSIMDKYMQRSNYRKSTSFGDMLKKDTKLNNLWMSVASGSGGNESETDLALCEKIAFYIGDNAEEVDKTFRQSPFYKSKDQKHKDKWSIRNDYREMTLKNAISTALQGRKTVRVQTTCLANRYTLDDTGNSHRFADTFGKTAKFNVDDQLWMIWNGKYWETDYKREIKNCVEIMTEQMRNDASCAPTEDERKAIIKNICYLRSKSGKDNCITEAEHLADIPVVNDNFDTQDWSICADNGVIDLKTGSIFPFDKALMMSKSTHCECDMKNEPKKFIIFLRDIIRNHPELYDYLHRLFGYGLTNSIREQEMYILFGDGNDGKSLLLEILSDVIGDYAHTAKADLVIESKYQNKSLTQVAQLKGARFVSIEEIKPDDRLDEANVKMYTSGLGQITGKFLYANEFTFSFKGKMFMATNYEPRVLGTDKGIWRRLRVIPFDRNLKDNEVNKDLKEEIMQEKNQILGWLVKGCVEYVKNGLQTPQCVLDMTQNYRGEQDVILAWMNDRCDTSNADDCSTATELYQDYINWCIKNNEYKMSQTLFGRNLGRKFKKKTLCSGRVYYGIRVSGDVMDLSKANVANQMDKINIDEGDI